MAFRAYSRPPLTAEQAVSAADTICHALAALGPGGQITVALIAAAFAAVEGMHETASANGVPSQCGCLGPEYLDPELASALADYRAVLQQWNAQLPRVQGWLLAERARLETCLGHAASVRTWLEANRQTR